MESILSAYGSSVSALGYVAALLFAQLVVVDVLGVMRRHPPGTAVEADHGDPLFRASRTVGNSNESIAVFLAGLLFCVGAGASPTFTGYAAWGFAGARTLYAGCYYANLQLPRSLCFGLSLVALAALILIGFLA